MLLHFGAAAPVGADRRAAREWHDGQPDRRIFHYSVQVLPADWYKLNCNNIDRALRLMRKVLATVQGLAKWRSRANVVIQRPPPLAKCT